MLTILFLGLVSAVYVSAQNVLIENKAGEKRKHISEFDESSKSITTSGEPESGN